MKKFDLSQPVANIGMGVMGTKVAWACARAGIATRVFDLLEGKAAESRQLSAEWGTEEDQNNVRQNILVCASLEEALDGVQLAFENVPERLALKQQVLGEIGSKLNEDAYMGTNASSLLCTPLAEASGRPEQFFNLNFSDPRVSRLVELMTCDKTAPATIDFAQDWAKAIKMIPVRTRKEQLGYSFNRVWRAIKKEVLRQINEGYTTPEEIDRAWMLIFGTDYGPCGLMDDIGLHSVLAVEKVYYENSQDPSDNPPACLVDMVEKNGLGLPTGKGFYTYPDPAYRQRGFLEGKVQNN